MAHIKRSERRKNEFQITPGSTSNEEEIVFDETDEEFSERWDKAEQEMIMGKVISLDDFIRNTDEDIKKLKQLLEKEA